MAFPRLGKLRHQISISEYSDSDVDAIGQPESAEGSSAVATNVWASIEWEGGEEYVDGDQVRGRRKGKVVTRYNSAITPTCRITYAGRIFNIEYVIDMDDRRAFMEIGIVEQNSGAV